MRWNTWKMGAAMLLAGSTATLAGCAGDPLGVAITHVIEDTPGGARDASRGGFSPADTVIIAQSLRTPSTPDAVGKSAAGSAVGVAPR